MKKILVCTDYSENAKKAVEHCFSLFPQEAKHYSLLNTFNIPDTHSENIVELVDGIKFQANKTLTEECARIRAMANFNSTTVDKHIVFGDTVNVVNRFSAKNKVDLIVVGNQGQNLGSNKTFGSTTERLLFEVPLPKLVVPHKVTENRKATQLVITEQHQLENKTWCSTVSSLAKSLNYRIQLVLVSNVSIPSFHVPPHFDSDIVVHFINNKPVGEINECLNRIVNTERPSLLHINISDLALAQQIIQKASPVSSICTEAPLFIQPFQPKNMI